MAGKRGVYWNQFLLGQLLPLQRIVSDLGSRHRRSGTLGNTAWLRGVHSAFAVGKGAVGQAIGMCVFLPLRANKPPLVF